MAASDPLHLAILSSPGTGHLIPVLVLARRLALSHRVKTTVLIVTVASSPSDCPNINLPDDLVRIIHLSPVDISHLVNPSTRVVAQLCLTLRAAVPTIRSAVAALNPRPDALIVDLFCTDSLPVAAELNIPKYVFVPSTAWFTAFFLYSPIFHQEIVGEYVDRKEYLNIPGCKPVRPKDVVDPMLDRTDPQYGEYVNMGRQIPLSDGILVNSWADLEPETLRAFAENEIWKQVLGKPVYPIGPLTKPVEGDGLENDVIKWLNRQPNKSVIYISFGSGGMLSAAQITELAWGLELSRQRFVWVIRPPAKHRVDDAFFVTGNDGIDGSPEYLPDGFAARMEGVGLLVPDWAPQVEILNHAAVGGFLTHSGWNSTLESIAGGVPMMAWPLYAEQRMNAAFLAEEAGVAVRPVELPAERVVGREEIEKLVRELMEGKEGKTMREKVAALRRSGAAGLEEGGTSHGAMCELLSKISAVKNK